MSVARDRFIDIRVNPSDIFQLRVMLESYEGLGYMTTISDDSTVVRIHFLVDQEPEIMSLVISWQAQSLVEIVAKGRIVNGNPQSELS